jgi:dipeptidyl aminopeptidase/acylaminoacyl peptidase
MVDTADALGSLPAFRYPTVDPDGERVALWWLEGGDLSLSVLDAATGEHEDVLTGEVDVENPAALTWGDDGLVVSTRPETYLLGLDGSAETVLPEVEYTLVHGVDDSRLLYVHYGDDWSLRQYDHATGERVVVDDEPAQFGHAGFSPDGERVAYHRNPTDDRGGGTLVLAAPDGDHRRDLAVGDPDRRVGATGWHPDGERLVVVDWTPGVGRAGLLDVEAGDATWFGPGRHPEVPVAVSPDGGRVLATRIRDGYRLPVVYGVASGEGRELDVVPGRVGQLGSGTAGAFLDADTLVLSNSTATEPPHLLAYDLATDDHEVLVSTRTDALDGVALVPARWVTYESPDGLDVDAVLYRPAGAAAGDPAPAVVWAHGGPHGKELRGFDRLAQFLVAAGYAVLEANYRGSTHRGRAFREALVGEVGRGDVEDVAAGARWLAGHEWVDADRVALVGHSSGGRLAYQMAFRDPDPFAVVVPYNGYPDLHELYADPNDYALRLLADPDEEIPLLRGDLNPIENVEKVGCPVRVVHGEQEHNVDVVERYVDALAAAGGDVELDVLGGEGHVVQDHERFWRVLADVVP